MLIMTTGEETDLERLKINIRDDLGAIRTRLRALQKFMLQSQGESGPELESSQQAMECIGAQVLAEVEALHAALKLKGDE